MLSDIIYKGLSSGQGLAILDITNHILIHEYSLGPGFRALT